MTNEEAIKILKIERGYFCDFKGCKEQQALTMAIKALEQQPCEDCISREALVNELKCGYWNKELQSTKTDPCVIDAMINWSIRTVKSQPSVTPQPKMGRWWERNTYPQECRCWDCSECQETVFERTNYCPNCGVKMEVEE